jgi:hypothetical protein
MVLPLQLREYELDYYITALVVLLTALCISINFKKNITWYDAGWVVSLAAAIPFIITALIGGKDYIVISTQALIFVLPIISLGVRSAKIQIHPKKIERYLVWLVLLKLIVMALNYEALIYSLKNSGDRARYHDFSSIILCFVILSALLFDCIKSKGSKFFLLSSLVVFALIAAHRSLFIALLAQVIIWFFRKDNNISPKMAFRLLFATLPFGATLLFTEYGHVIISLFDDSIKGTDGNTNYRMELYIKVLSSSFDDFFGNGFGNQYKFGTDSKGGHVFYALHHNSFLTYLYYLGWIPAIAFVVSVLFFLKPAIKYRPEVAIWANCICGMAVFAIFNLFFEHPIYGFFFWIVVGLFSSQLIKNRKETLKNVPRDIKRMPRPVMSDSGNA